MMAELMTKRGDSSLGGFPSAGSRQWPETPWELVRRARDGDGAAKSAALNELITLYYKPVYRFFQRVLDLHGERLKDVTQEFFTRFIEKEFLRGIAEEKSFRGFLKVACRRHYLNWREAEEARSRLRERVRPARSEEQCAEILDEELRRWYVEEAVARVRARLVADGKQVYFDVFEARVRFDGGKPVEYETLARQVGRRVYDVRNYLTVARKAFREALVDLAASRSRDGGAELRELGLDRYLA